MKLWKVFSLEVSTRLVNGVMSSIVSTVAGQMWDLQNDHSTIFFTAAGPGRDIVVNQEVPTQYQSISRYSSPSGLTEIMR